MRLFRKMKPPLSVSSTVTLIGEGSVVEGELFAPADLRIEGEMKGKLRSDGEIVIGERGYVRSHLHARDIIIAGRVEGIVRAEGTVRITSTGSLHGTVQASTLVIEPGAVFQGNSEVLQQPQEDAVLTCVMV
jgi:cytoskeletal protein CcmA (bactofilin family)